MAETYNMSGGAVSLPNSTTTIRNTGEAGIEYSFVNGHDSPLVQGQLVMLNSTGEIIPNMFEGTRPIGTVLIGNEPGKKVTVKTCFKQIVSVATTAYPTPGTNLAATGFNSDLKMNMVQVAVATNYASYVSLEPTGGAGVRVLIAGELFQPILTA